MSFLLIGSLLPIIWQDFKERSIHIVYLLIFVLISMFSAFKIHGFSFILENVLLSFSFFILLYFSLVGYFSIKHQKIEWIIDNQLGAGDLLFWVGLIFQFCFPQLLVFFIGSSICILVIYFKNKKTIPLAGLQAIFLLIILLIDFLTSYDRFYNYILI